MKSQKSFREMWKHIPIKRRFEMKEYIEKMGGGLDKEVLTLLFIEDMNPREVANYAKEHNCCIGKQLKPLSCRRIQQIATQHFPDLYSYTPKSAHFRQAHRELTTNNELKKECARCGSNKNLELHHMIPLFLGGTSDLRNVIFLCRDCHLANTAYLKELFPKYFLTKKEKVLENGDVQLMF